MDFATHLRLETAQKKLLAESHNITPDKRTARIVFAAKEDGLYRIIATSLQRGGIGAYTETIREFKRKKD